MKCAFLYNQNSGKGKIAKKLPLIRRELQKVYKEVAVVQTQSVQDLQAQVKIAAQSCDAIVFSGGDGTFHQVLQGLNGSQIPLGYLPSGTVNDVARSLKIPRSLRGALKVVVQNQACAIDGMRVNGNEYTAYVVAAGAFTSATYETSQKQKRAFGMLAYLFRALRKNMKWQVFSVTVRTEEEKFHETAVLLLVMNGTSLASFPVNRNGSMTDGKMEVILLRQTERPNFFQRAGKYFSLVRLLLFGVKKSRRGILRISGSKIDITVDEGITWDLDGERGMSGTVYIESVKNAFQIFLPKDKK